MYQKLSAPVSCQIEVTTACNLNCFHCYNYWRHGEHIHDVMMTEQILDAIVSQIVESKVFHTTFTGGEPLANRKILFRGIESLTQAGVVCDVNSNLTLITPTDAQRLVRAGIGGVLTSFASGREKLHDEIMQKKGAFLSVVKGIKIAQDSGLTVAASMVVTKLNVDSILETGEFLKSVGVKQFYVTKASPPINSTNFGQYLLSHEELIKLLDSVVVLRDEHKMDVGALECYPLCSYLDQTRYSFMSGRRCSAGVTTCSISARGDVRACSHDSTVYGNILSDGLSGAWDKMSDWRSGALLPQECRLCQLFPHCSGGCRVDAEYACGSKKSLDPYAMPEELSKVILRSKDNEIPNLENRVFTVTSPLYSRKEDFCVLCANRAGIASPITLSPDTFEMLESFQHSRFTVEDIERYTELDTDSATQLCVALSRDGLITATPTEGGEK